MMIDNTEKTSQSYSFFRQFENDSITTFDITPVLSTYSFAWAILPRDEFSSATQEFANTTVSFLNE